MTGATACFGTEIGQNRCQNPEAITQVQRTVVQGSQVLADDTVALPDYLPVAWRNERTHIHYTLDVSACASVPGSAVWLFRVGAPFQINAGGVGLSSLLAHANPVAAVFNGRIPALFALPEGTRTVRVDLMTLPYISAGLSDVQTGPIHQLTPMAIATIDEVVGYADAGAGVLGVLGAITLALWFKRRKDLGLMLMGVACGLWSLRALAYFDSVVHLPALWFEQSNSVGVLLTSVALAAATVWTWGSGNQRVKTALLALVGVALLAVVATTALGQGALGARALAMAGALGVSLWTVTWLLRQGPRMAAWPRWALLGGYATLIACGVHDIMLVTGPLAPTGPTYLFWGFTGLLVGFVAISGEYLVASLNQAERGNSELTRRVTDKTNALEQSYAHLRGVELATARDAARVQERERLMRDMHDGMGTQLMTALRGVERGTLTSAQVAQSLQDGLDELRLLMDSSDNTQALQTALANWRNRWDARLNATGLTLHWHLDDAIETLELPGDTVLQIMRVLQEAATNIVKHAHASEATVSATVAPAGTGFGRALVLAVSDNGRGLAGLPAGGIGSPGHGIRNMQHRAQHIGATLTLAGQALPLTGTVVRLALPL